MAIKIILLIAFFAVMIGVGIYCRKSATDVNGFVLGGRSVGPWLTAFAYGTSYFSAVIFVGFNMDRSRQRIYRFASRLGNSRQTNKSYDSAPQLGNHAAVLRLTL